MVPIQNEPIWREVESLISSYVTDHPDDFEELCYPDINWINEIDWVVRGILRYPESALRFIEEKCGDEGTALLNQIHEEVVPCQ